MPLTLYSLRSEINVHDATRYRITKFVDGEVESSYHTSRGECECPAGARPTCRHRQMLPHMLNANIVNTHWFYEFDRGDIVDFEGTPRRQIEAMIAPNPIVDEIPHRVASPTAAYPDLTDAAHATPPQPAAFRRRI